jgi:hypothetical protein
MKRIFSMIAIFLAIGSTTAFAQIGGAMDKLSKQGSAAKSEAQKSSTASALSNLDKQLKEQFKLDGVKSSVVGDALKIKVANSDFTKLSAASKTKQGNDMLGSALRILTGSGLNLKSMGLKSVILEMFKSMTINDVLSTAKKTL